MKRVLRSPELGPLLAVDRPVPVWRAWAVIVMVGAFLGGWPFWFLVGSGIPWSFAVPATSVGIVVALYALGERALLEQRLHERALVSRSLVPFVAAYVIPLAAVDLGSIEVDPRTGLRNEVETYGPVTRLLRSVPWGPTVRLRGPSPRVLRRLRRPSERLAPETWGDLVVVTGPAPVWVFSFSEPEAAAEHLRAAVRSELDRLGPRQRPFLDPLRWRPDLPPRS